MIRRIVGIYFSPVGGTARMTEELVGRLTEIIRRSCPVEVTSECYDLLRFDAPELELDDETVAIIGMPVYVGKIPIPAIRAMRSIRPGGAFTAIAVSYGGRTYGNALYELRHFAEEQGFKVVGAGAFSVRYTRHFASPDRVTSVDLDSLDEFGDAAASKIMRLAGCEIDGLRVRPAPLEVAGRLPFHGISRFMPGAAAVAQELLERLSLRHRESEWYL